MLTLMELEACTVASKHLVLKFCTDCAVRPAWVILPSLMSRAVELHAESGDADNTFYAC